MTTVIYIDTIEEFEETIQELESNPDFTCLGDYNLIQDIYEKLEEQGFSELEIKQMAANKYGRCLDIIEFESHYTAYIGNR